MKSYLYLFLSIVLFTSCLKEDSFDPEIENDIIEYIKKNNLTATKTASGLYYIVNNEGTGKAPTESSIVDVDYKGYFLDGTVFAKNEGAIFNLSKEIPGFKEGLQLFKEGGDGTLILPYELAYGESGSDSIPGGAVLIFDIKVNAAYTDYEEYYQERDELAITNYTEENNLNPEKTESGLYYIVNKEGTGKTPTENSIVDLKYKTYFLDGTENGKSESIILNLSTIFSGLREGIQLFKEGGSGTLIIPSRLAFGESGNSTGSIPSGTVLVFEIEVLAVYDNYEAQNEAAILKYIDDNNLEAIKTESGLYYIVNKEGTGTQPTSTSNVTVAYKGYFLNDNVFDQSDSNGISFGLDKVIKGWTEGIPYFMEGGEGILLIPYTLGYGQYGSGSIPGYTPLAFDVKLISVNN